MVIFDARDFNPPWGAFVLTFLVITIVVIAIYYDDKSRKKSLLVTRNLLTAIGLSILFVIANFISYRAQIGNDNDLKNLLVKNKCQTIEGTVKNLISGVDGKTDNESFSVNNVLFKYSPAIFGNGFNQQLKKNGLAKSGNRVRLCYIKTDWNNAILYFYVFKSP
jgi:hypothetical protein